MTREEKKQMMNEVLANTMADLQRRITMRELALQHLREVYEAARDVRPESDHWDATAWAENADKLFEDGFSHPSWDTHCHPMVEAARHYIIARDFGEWDRNKALMIWKQRNGGAL